MQHERLIRDAEIRQIQADLEEVPPIANNVQLARRDKWRWQGPAPSAAWVDVSHGDSDARCVYVDDRRAAQVRAEPEMLTSTSGPTGTPAGHGGVDSRLDDLADRHLRHSARFCPNVSGARRGKLPVAIRSMGWQLHDIA